MSFSLRTQGTTVNTFGIVPRDLDAPNVLLTGYLIGQTTPHRCELGGFLLVEQVLPHYTKATITGIDAFCYDSKGQGDWLIIPENCAMLGWHIRHLFYIAIKDNKPVIWDINNKRQYQWPEPLPLVTVD